MKPALIFAIVTLISMGCSKHSNTELGRNADISNRIIGIWDIDEASPKGVTTRGQSSLFQDGTFTSTGTLSRHDTHVNITFSGTENKSINEQIIVQTLASNNVQATINIITDIEKLWPQQPQVYFRSAKEAASILGGATNNFEARSALLNLFSNVIQKPFPTNEDLAILYLQEKDSVILYYFNFKEVRDDKSRLIAIAKYIGDIRAQIIPNFIPKTVYLNPPGVMDLSSQKVQQAIEENEKNKAVNGFQQELNVANNILTFQLLHNINGFQSNDPTNADFIQKIISFARLNKEEQQQL